MPDERTHAPDAADLQREIDRVRHVCAEAYQLAGAMGAPERVLDTVEKNSV